MDTISVIIETPAGSSQKFTFDPVEARIKLKKILPVGMAFPFDFGFIPGTKGGDNDPIDVVVISEFPTFAGCSVECRIIGAFIVEQEKTRNSGKMIRNDRFIAVPVESLLYKKINTLGNLPKTLVKQLESFFLNYIEEEGKKIKIEKRISSKQAWKLIGQFEDKLDKILLFEIFLPMKNDRGKIYPQLYFDDLRRLFVEKFGGVTMHRRSPVTGVWDNPGSGHEQDELVVYEVMASTGDQFFWTQLKKKLENQFNQESVLIRSSLVNIL